MVPFLFAALVFSTSAFARVGETTEQLNKRYGPPVQKNNGNDHVFWTKSDSLPLPSHDEPAET